MATAMIYDTLKLAEQLEREAGFEATRARALARVLAENTGGNLATREDLLVFKSELQAQIQSVRSDLGEKLGSLEVKIDALDGRNRSLEGKVGSLEGKVGSLERRTGSLEGKVAVLCWVTGTTLAGVAAILGIAITMALHSMHLE